MTFRRLLPLLVLCLVAVQARADNLWWDGFAPLGFNRAVNSAVIYNGDLIVAGDFSYNGKTTISSIARWDGFQWQPMPQVGSFVRTESFAEYNGELYLGEYNGLIKWDGIEWTSAPGSFYFGLFEAVQELIVYDGKLIAGGNFSEVDGLGNGSLAAWNGSSWEALGGYTWFNGGGAFAFAVYDSNLYVGSSFASIAGTTAHGLARWDGTSWTAVYGSDGVTSEEGVWAGVGSSSPGDVRALAVWNGKLVIAGNFEEAGTLPISNLVAWDGATQMWEAIGIGGADAPVNSIGFYNSDLTIGGEFSTAGGIPAAHVGRWNGSSWSALGTGTNGNVLALLQSGTELVVAGDFGMAGGGRASKFAMWDGTSYTPRHNPQSGLGLDDETEALTEYDGKLVAAGRFTHAGAIEARRVATWDGSSWQSLGTGANNIVLALHANGTDLYAGGLFTEIGGVNASKVARWDGTSWNAIGAGLAGDVFAVTTHNGNVYAGFDSLFCWNGTSWSLVPPATPITMGIRALESYGGHLVVGGSYILNLSGTYTAVGLWDGTQWLSMLGALNGQSAVGTVGDMAIWDGDLIICGVTQVDGLFPDNQCGTWDGTALAPLLPQGGSGLHKAFSLAVNNGNLYVGGEKSTNGYALYRRAPGGTTWEVPLGHVGSSAEALQGYQGDLYVGGRFHWAGPDFTPSSRIARLICAPTAADSPASQRFALHPNYPNPFNPSTTIRYEVPEDGSVVTLSVFDAKGRLVRTLVAGVRDAGPHTTGWDGTNDRGQRVASGVYFYDLTIGLSSLSGKMVLLK